MGGGSYRQIRLTANVILYRHPTCQSDVELNIDEWQRFILSFIVNCVLLDIAHRQLALLELSSRCINVIYLFIITRLSVRFNWHKHAVERRKIFYYILPLRYFSFIGVDDKNFNILSASLNPSKLLYLTLNF